MIGSSLVTLLFDVGLGSLLVVTIMYCSRLSRRIKMLQDGRSEFATMLVKFDTATNRAMASVTELQTISKRMTDALQLKIEKANFLADDLAFLIEKSNKLITQLEQIKLPLEKELKRPAPAPMPASVPLSALAPERPKQSVHDLIHVLATSDLSELDVPSVATNPEPRVVPRTGAERELISALKAGNR